jgi:hypothetical protein
MSAEQVEYDLYKFSYWFKWKGLEIVRAKTFIAPPEPDQSPVRILLSGKRDKGSFIGHAAEYYGDQLAIGHLDTHMDNRLHTLKKISLDVLASPTLKCSDNELRRQIEAGSLRAVKKSPVSFH